MDYTELGMTAYEAYRTNSGGRSLVTNQPIPEWGKLHEAIQAAWIAAAKAVAQKVRLGDAA